MKLHHKFIPAFACMIVLAILATGSSCKKQILTQEAAFERIQTLPEVQEYTAQLSEKGSRAFVRLESSDNRSSPIEFSVGESHPTHTITWNRFSVDPSNGNISVFDIESGEYMPIKEWRKTEN